MPGSYALLHRHLSKMLHVLLWNSFAIQGRSIVHSFWGSSCLTSHPVATAFNIFTSTQVAPAAMFASCGFAGVICWQMLVFVNRFERRRRAEWC
jgi:hypothetical protein